MQLRTVLRVEDVAVALGLSKSRVYQLLEAGAIPHVRLGRSVVVPREAWERWLAEQRDLALAVTRGDHAARR